MSEYRILFFSVMLVVSGKLSVSIVKVVSVVISGQDFNGQVKSGHESGHVLIAKVVSEIMTTLTT
jgi:hypothetical protein